MKLQVVVVNAINVEPQKSHALENVNGMKKRKNAKKVITNVIDRLIYF